MVPKLEDLTYGERLKEMQLTKQKETREKDIFLPATPIFNVLPPYNAVSITTSIQSSLCITLKYPLPFTHFNI